MVGIGDESSPEQSCIAGARSETIALNNLYIPNDTAFLALRNAWKANTSIIVERQESGAVIEYATALISQMTEDFKMAAAGTVAVTLQVSGGWTPGAAPWAAEELTCQIRS